MTQPFRYLADADRIRRHGGHVANGKTSFSVALIPYYVWCKLAQRGEELPCLLTLDESSPASEPLLKVAGRIPTLTSLDLTRSDVDDRSFDHLSSLRDVRDLRVQGRPITNSSMKIVGKWCELTTASFQGTIIDDNGVAHLRHCVLLTELSLRSTRISDKSVVTLSRLTSLRRLDVSCCRLSESAIKQLRAALPDCEIETRCP